MAFFVLVRPDEPLLVQGDNQPQPNPRKKPSLTKAGGAQIGMTVLTNRLASQPSLYPRQHATTPLPAAVGRTKFAAGQRRAAPAGDQHRLCCLSLVPRDGARIVRRCAGSGRDE